MTRKTNWCVITGAPCSGKTTVIRALEASGFPVVHESARSIIEGELAAGRDPGQIRRDPLAFQRRVLSAKLALERRLPALDTVFLDRGIPDSIAYFRLSGLDPEAPLYHAHRVRYRRIFFFERLPLTADKVRSEAPETVARLDALITAAYRELGYAVIRVPVLGVAARVDFVLARL